MATQTRLAKKKEYLESTAHFVLIIPTYPKRSHPLPGQAKGNGRILTVGFAKLIKQVLVLKISGLVAVRGADLLPYETQRSEGTPMCAGV